MKTISRTIDFVSIKVIASMEHRIRGIIKNAKVLEKLFKNLNTQDDTERLLITWNSVLNRTKNKMSRLRATPITGPITHQ